MPREERSATIVIFARLLQAASNLPTDASALESSISALESEIKTLESSSVPWEHLLPAFNAMVVFGVAMELWVIWHERRDDMEAWAVGYFLNASKLPSRPSTAKFLIEVASVLLITLGIVGELGVGIKIASINGALRGKSAELRSKSGQLVALLNQETEQLHRDAEGLKAENLRLEAVIAPRSLSLDQQKQIADALRKFKGHGVLVKSYGTDGEGAALAAQIIAALHAAEVVVADSRGSEIVAGGFDSGVHVRAPATEIDFAVAIADALSKIGKLKVFPVNDPEPRVGAMMGGGGQSFTNPHAVFVTVRVGIKPLPTLPMASNAATTK
jgi:hypothetical protein